MGQETLDYSLLVIHNYKFTFILLDFFCIQAIFFVCLSRTYISFKTINIREVIVRLVDIGGIIDHHCLNFLLAELG
jgi:hypothetical protein